MSLKSALDRRDFVRTSLSVALPATRSLLPPRAREAEILAGWASR